MGYDSDGPGATASETAALYEKIEIAEGGLELLLAAVKAGDPQHEIIWRIEEELRELRK